MVCFVSKIKPVSVQASGVQNYKKRLIDEFEDFKTIFTEIPLNNDLYSKIIYIHSKKADIDVDNMSKPFVDAFKNIIYPDDGIINHRICSKIRLDDFEAFDFNLNILPDEVAERFDELLQNGDEHIVYFEVGRFKNSMVRIGE